MNYDHSFYNSVGERGTVSASIVFSHLKEVFCFRNVLDYGCGAGTWTFAAQETYPDATFDLVDLPDSPLFHLKKSNGLSQSIELHDSNEFDLNSNKSYDLGVCLEVLEHLHSEFADEVAEFLARNCKVLLFSAAVPGQGGTNHVNERPYSYWISHFRDKGFLVFDFLRYELSKHPEVPSYYRNNVILFIKKDNLLDSKLVNLELFLNLLSKEDPRDRRSRTTKVLHFFLSFLPAKFVTALSKLK